MRRNNLARKVAKAQRRTLCFSWRALRPWRETVFPACAMAFQPSEVELARHLHRTIASGAGDLPEAGAAEARVGQAPLRRVGHAERLQTELHVLPFRDVEVLHQRGILVHQ